MSDDENSEKKNSSDSNSSSLDIDPLLLGAAYIYHFTGKEEQITAMKALKQAGFTLEEAKNRSLQRRLQRTVKKLVHKFNAESKTPPPLIVNTKPTTATLRSSVSDLSLYTNASSLVTYCRGNTLDTTTPSPKRKIVPTTESSVKKTRRTSKQKFADAAREQEKKARENKAFFAACARWRIESKKPRRERESARDITDHFNKLYGTSVNETTVRRKVKSNTDNCAPRKGRKVTITKEMEECLRSAILSYIKLTCVAMKVQPNRKDLIERLERCLDGGPVNIKCIDQFLTRLMAGIALDLEAVVANTKMEARRVNWSTFNNINTWFETLKAYFIDNGFATEPADTSNGELLFEEEQLHRILNVDESEVSLDGTTKLMGGRPVTEYQVRGSKLPNGTTRTNKSSYSATFIGGSTASGYPIPPHFQLKSDARDENKKISIEFMEKVPSVQGYYGFGELTQRGVTFNMNAKAGMDTEEFEKYVKDSIVPLYPDAQDVAGKRVALIVDSGPGRVNEDLLSFLRARGFYLLPGVPNTTHVTQATDVNYGSFKTIYRKNLSALTKKRMTMKRTIRPADIPFLVFGGKEDKLELQSAFDIAFAVSKSKQVWKDIGIYPFNRNCLQDKNVVHELIVLPDGTIDLTKDPLQSELLKLQKANKTVVQNLYKFGLNGEEFKQELCTNKGKKAIGVTVPNTKERQDALTKAKSAGERFIVTGGGALNSDDFFIGKARERVKDRIEELKAQKSKWEQQKKNECHALGILEKVEASSGKDPYTEEGAKVLKRDQLVILFEWKKGKKPQQMNKKELLKAWMESKDSPRDNSKSYNWTNSDSEELERLETDEIHINDTVLGKERQRLVKQSIAALTEMSKEELNAQLLGVDKEKLRRMLDE